MGIGWKAMLTRNPGRLMKGWMVALASWKKSSIISAELPKLMVANCQRLGYTLKAAYSRVNAVWLSTRSVLSGAPGNSGARGMSVKGLKVSGKGVGGSDLVYWSELPMNQFPYEAFVVTRLLMKWAYLSYGWEAIRFSSA